MNWTRTPTRLRRFPRLTVRVRMTMLVGAAAILVLVPATVFGPTWVEQALVDDVFDDEAALQAELIEPLVGLMRQYVVDDATTIDAAQSAGSVSFAGDATRRVFDALADLDNLGHLDALLQVTETSRESGVPVAMSDGALLAFPLDNHNAPSRLDFADLNSPVISVFNLFDLAFEVRGFELPKVETAISELGTTAETASADALFVGQSVAFATRNIGGTDFVVSADISNVNRSISRVEAILWRVIPLTIIVQVLVAWKLIGRALRPVEQITEEVREINAGTLSERVAEPGTGDEIDRLAVTMNIMLNRLEGSDTKLRQFVSDASHELRTPVAVLHSDAEVALRQPAQTEVEVLASGVLFEAKRLQRIVDDLLVLVRHDEHRSLSPSVPVDLDEVIWEEAARSRGVAVVVGAVSAGRVSGTPESLKRIVAHLLDNAAHYARERIAVSLTTQADASSTLTQARETVLTIDDDGPGIAEADRERIFERFTRLSEARSRDSGGAGLGLAVVKALVTELNGNIVVADSPLGGARFIVTFPLYE